MPIPGFKLAAKALFAFGLLLAAFAGSAMTANAAGQTQVSGVGTPDSVDSPQCTDDPDAWFVMVITGDLQGCWYNHGWVVDKFTPSGAYSEHGTETFVGCYHETICGSFDTTYTFEGKYTPDFVEIMGRCQHPLVSGTGGFAGITGRIHFTDDVVLGVFNYDGHFAIR